MPALLHSVLVQNQTILVSTRTTVDLPVNPLSVVWVTLRAIDTTAVTSPRATLASLLGLITNIACQFKGADQFSASFTDAYIMAACLSTRPPKHNSPEVTATTARFITVPIYFGRYSYDPAECFPATRRGEFRLIIDTAASFGVYTTVTLQIETSELLDVQPTKYIKVTTLARTWPATGQQDLDLPLGNPILGALLFGTTFPTGGVFTTSWGNIQTLIDNVNFTYTNTNFETLQNMLQNRVVLPWDPYLHAHTENLAAAYAQAAVSDVSLQARDVWRQYAYMDWDPNRDDVFALMTAGRGRVILRANAGIADAVRVLPVELIRLAPTG